MSFAARMITDIRPSCRMPAVYRAFNVVCEIYAAVYNNIQKGNLKKARKEEVRLEKAARLFKYGQNLAAFKYGLGLRD